MQHSDVIADRTPTLSEIVTKATRKAPEIANPPCLQIHEIVAESCPRPCASARDSCSLDVDADALAPYSGREEEFATTAQNCAATLLYERIQPVHEAMDRISLNLAATTEDMRTLRAAI